MKFISAKTFESYYLFFRSAVLLSALFCTACSLTSRSTLVLDPSVPGKTLPRIYASSAKQYLNKLKNPVPGSKLTSSFGWRAGKFHEGLDLSAKEGTTVRAAHAGEVVMLRKDFSKYGNLLAIRNGSILTVYAHNRKNFVDIGDKVKAGEDVGEVGQTGNATGPHLHFEVRIRDSYGRYVAVDPKYFFIGDKAHS